MNPYTAFAEFYDQLTENVDYPKRAEYICRLLRRHGHTMGLTLDLACGTGSLTVALAKQGVDIYGADASAAMLTIAKEKAAHENLELLFLCQRMEKLDLFGTVNTVLCTLDSVNHITEPAILQRAFARIALFLEPGGVFVFDVNTPYKHRHILQNNTFVYETETVYCVWQNALESKTNLVEITLDFFCKQQNGDYRRLCESFCERAYELAELTQLAEAAGLQMAAAYNDMTLEPATQENERWVIVCKKPAQNK